MHREVNTREGKTLALKTNITRRKWFFFISALKKISFSFSFAFFYSYFGDAGTVACMKTWLTLGIAKGMYTKFGQNVIKSVVLKHFGIEHTRKLKEHSKISTGDEIS